MILKPDYTGRFPERPHWEIDELEQRCEEILTPFLESRYGQPPARVPTQDLLILIDREAEELDLHSELIADRPGEEIHGVTWFFPGAKPKVQINRHFAARVPARQSLPHHAGPRIRTPHPPYVALRSLPPSASPDGRAPMLLFAHGGGRIRRHDRLDGVAGELCERSVIDAALAGRAPGPGFR